MKKWILLALCIMLVMMAAMPVFAAEQPKVTITADKTTVARGDEINFKISLSGDTPFTSMGILLWDAKNEKSVFDPQFFEYVSYSKLTPTEGNHSIEYDGKSIMLMLAAGGTCKGEILSIKYKVKNTAPIDETTITGSASATAVGGGSLTVPEFFIKISVDHEHTFPATWSQGDANKHKKVCTTPGCGKVLEEAHDWDEGTPVEKATCTKAGKEKFKCLVCEYEKTEDIPALNHAWSNACDTVCNNDSSHTRTVNHQYKTAWSSDKNGHWHQCQICGNKKDQAAHTPGPAATEQAAQTCTVCKYEIAPQLAHVHEFSKEWITDGEAHWHRCEKRQPACYAVIDKADHDYDDDCDVDCNTCGYVRVAPHTPYPEWRTSAEGHWKVCSKCGVQSEVYPHSPGPEATEENPQICEDCNFRIKWPLSHVHTGTDVWHNDDENHWHTCLECQESVDKAAHEWDEGVVLTEATETQDGVMQLTCTVCGKQIESAIPNDSEESTTGPSDTGTQPGTSSAPATKPDEQSGGFPWEWAGLAALLLLLVGIGLLVFEFIRSRKTNSHGRFSK